jgi:hypothetical protein
MTNRYARVNAALDTYSSDQLFKFVRFCSVSFHDAPDSDEGHETEKEEDEADDHVQRQRHEHLPPTS